VQSKIEEALKSLVGVGFTKIVAVEVGEEQAGLPGLVTLKLIVLFPALDQLNV
jgi:hypothetical protein